MKTCLNEALVQNSDDEKQFHKMRPFNPPLESWILCMVSVKVILKFVKKPSVRFIRLSQFNVIDNALNETYFVRGSLFQWKTDVMQIYSR